jgi:hypothetical protein
MSACPGAEAGGAIASNCRPAGETCFCTNRILVQDGVYDAFTERLAKTAGTMKVADGFERGAVIGPLMYMKAAEKVEAHIADALKKGAKVVTGGKRAAQRGREGGRRLFLDPRHWPQLARRRGARIRHRRHQPGHHLGREGVIRYAAADRRLSVHAPKRAAGPGIRLRLPSGEVPELTPRQEHIMNPYASLVRLEPR